MTDSTAPTMQLSARFDINQDGETLDWHFTRTDGEGHSIKGKDTGAIYFTRGEKFKIRVTGVSEKSFLGFDILGCTLISRPQVYSCGPEQKTVYAPPSPFITGLPPSSLNAVVDIPAGQFVNASPVSEATTFIKDWSGQLVTGTTLARWELSFVITVSIRRANQPNELRVFCFDPETVVGGGVNPP